MDVVRRREEPLVRGQQAGAALHLVTLEGMAYADAAQVLAIPIGTLMSRLGRARAALRSFEDGPATNKPRKRPTDPPERGRPLLRLVYRDGRPDDARSTAQDPISRIAAPSPTDTDTAARRSSNEVA